ncbi:unnamed protein product [Cyclocybe aegerita]|uniref:Uncharacterized protein n=1 Tax=Cyclocybe aegerita TaxID=1973307 RepID=A0A8S0VZY0_CYCAE|nr:unnamed protein product [Cyclocybe aegerita]
MGHLVNVNWVTSQEVKNSFQSIIESLATHSEKLQQLSRNMSTLSRNTGSTTPAEALSSSQVPDGMPNSSGLFQSDFVGLNTQLNANPAEFYPQANVLSQGPANGGYQSAMPTTVNPQALVLPQEPQFNFPNTLIQHQSNPAMFAPPFMPLMDLATGLNVNFHPIQRPSSMPPGMTLPIASDFNHINIERPRSGPIINGYTQALKCSTDGKQHPDPKRNHFG